MTAEPYTPDELPGVLKQLRKDYETWDDNYETCTAQIAGDRLLVLFPRLLATLEAMAADAERYRWLRDKAPLCSFQGMIDHGESGYTHAWWRIEVDAYRGMPLDEAIDAARREGCDGNP